MADDKWTVERMIAGMQTIRSYCEHGDPAEIAPLLEFSDAVIDHLKKDVIHLSVDLDTYEVTSHGVTFTVWGQEAALCSLFCDNWFLPFEKVLIGTFGHDVLNKLKVEPKAALSVVKHNLNMAMRRAGSRYQLKTLYGEGIQLFKHAHA